MQSASNGPNKGSGNNLPTPTMSSTAASTEMSSKSQAARQPFSNQEAMETQRTTTSVDSQEEKCELQTVGNEHMDARIELEATSNEKVAVPIESTNESLKKTTKLNESFLKNSSADQNGHVLSLNSDCSTQDHQVEVVHCVGAKSIPSGSIVIDYTKKTSAISNENGITQQRYFASTQNIKECPSNGADLPVLKNSSLASQEKLPDMTANKVQGYGFIPGLWDKIGIVGHRPWAANRAASVPSYTRIPRPPVVLSSTGMPTAPLQFGPVYPAPRQYDLGVQMRPRPDATQGSYGDNIITETPQKSKNEENDKVGTEQQQKHLPKSTSLLIHSIPPKTVGGLQDQLDLNNLSCWCKHKGRRSGSACLKLYCDCFLTGVYCGEKCRCSGSCSNNADETNVHPRTEAIVQALMKDPHAFRLAHNEIALIQKDHRIELMKSSPSSLKAKHRLKASTPSPWSKSYDAVHPVLKKRVDKSIKADKRPPVELLTAQLPPSYYSVPLRVVGGSTILTGLSFSLTHPRDRKKNRAKKPVQSPVKVPVLYSEIATVPSGSIHSRSSIIGPEQKRQRIDDHPGESFRGIEEERMAVFFQSIRAEIKPNEKPWSWFPFEKTQQVAFASYEAVVEDMENVKAAFAAAKTDILTRSYHENRLKRGATQASSESDTLTNADDETDDALRELECDEQIAPNQHVMDDGKVKELTVLAAQDTAILQEMSRIVRRMARELCERRGKNG